MRQSSALTISSLFFFCVSRGEVISSKRWEPYTTLQRSDEWLVHRLHLHYGLINQQRPNFLRDLISMKTIGFATFIRVCIP
jgi:hypothetical protein